MADDEGKGDDDEDTPAPGDYEQRTARLTELIGFLAPFSPYSFDTARGKVVDTIGGPDADCDVKGARNLALIDTFQAIRRIARES